jgi:hypothetical protein
MLDLITPMARSFQGFRKALAVVPGKALTNVWQQ